MTTDAIIEIKRTQISADAIPTSLPAQDRHFCSPPTNRHPQTPPFPPSLESKLPSLSIPAPVFLAQAPKFPFRNLSFSAQRLCSYLNLHP